MRGISQTTLGGPEVLELVELPRPVPGPTEVLVRVAAAGVNPVDWKVRARGGFLGEPPFTVGWDVGGDGNRTMMLVYDLPNSLSIYRRYAGVNGSAYLVGGLGMTVLANSETPERTVYVVPIRSGVGVRLGMNIGYLKFTQSPTWNPF